MLSVVRRGDRSHREEVMGVIGKGDGSHSEGVMGVIWKGEMGVIRRG